jgi:putative FmdB family regulatory protein
MPVYEFRCQSCGRLVRRTYSFSEYAQATPTCTHCGSTALRRRIGRVALAKGEEARMDSLLDDSALDNLSEDDPRALGRLMRQMSQEMGEDLGEEFGEVVDRLERGQSPEEIEQSMPELAEGEAGGMDAFDE